MDNKTYSKKNYNPSKQECEKRSKTISDKPSGLERYSQADYDSWLSEVSSSGTSKTYNPNPFDFVLITQKKPLTFKINDLETDEELYSGYMEVKLNALTPLHIVGRQTPSKGKEGQKIHYSYFYKEGNDCCIPGSSIKGMLRSFIEALTNGWVSQAQENNDDNPTYPKCNGNVNRSKGRHIGFDSFKVTENKHTSITSKIQPGIPATYHPASGGEIDIASYLFGIVLDKENLSFKHKVSIGDAIVNQNDFKNHKMIDIIENAFMGGGHPSASNWWYVMPSGIQERQGKKADGGPYHVFEMVGEGFWGRKFYFHQDPADCVKFYQDSKQWYSSREVYPYEAKCLDKEKSATFRIDFKRLPKAMIDLLCFALVPGNNIKHKIGYGKQYGYGSVYFEIKEIKYRKENEPLNLDNDADWTFNDYTPLSWDSRSKLKVAEKAIIDEEALLKLARILTWNDKEKIIYTYPPNRSGDFQTFIPISKKGSLPGVIKNGEEGIKTAATFWNTKRTIHFLLYQARAKGYKDIMNRTP